VRAGFGLAALPGFIADLDPDLIRCMPPAPENKMGLWLLTHERLRHTPRVRVVLDFLGERLAGLARSVRDRHEQNDLPGPRPQLT
jgi:DNA-binding transcriptional LysR family regulator